MQPDLENEIEEQSSGLDLQSIWSLVRRHRWHFAVPAFVAWAAIWTVSWFLPAVYRSGTLILVQPQRVPQQYVVPNVGGDIQDQLQSMTQQILSRTRLLHIVEKFNLYPKERRERGPEEVLDRMRKNDIEIELVPGNNERRDQLSAFRIYYSAHDPMTAQLVTSEIASLFIEENLRSRQEQAETTTEFLEQQLNDARASLTAQEQRVREFKMQHLGQLPTELQSNLQIMGAVQSQLQSETDALNRAEQQRMYLQSLMNQYRSATGDRSVSSGVLSTLDQELVREKTELAQISARDTENHPDIVRLKAQIAKTTKLRQQLVSDLGSAKSGSDSTDINDAVTQPGMAEIQSQLKANELEIENRRRSIKDLKAQIGAYQQRLSSTPIREEQMATLTRDYEQSKANYESLLAKKNQSELATNLEKEQQGQQFQVLDPPDLPTKPYSPNRMKLSLIALAVGLALGAATSMVLEMNDGRIHVEADLRELVSVGVLVEIPPLRTPQELRATGRRTKWEVAAGTAMVLVMAAGSVVTYLHR